MVKLKDRTIIRIYPLSREADHPFKKPTMYCKASFGDLLNTLLPVLEELHADWLSWRGKTAQPQVEFLQYLKNRLR